MKVKEFISKKQNYMHKALHHNEFGQHRLEFTFSEDQDLTTRNEPTAVSSMKK